MINERNIPMTTVQNVHSANEEDEFILQQGFRSGPFARKIAVLMRINGRIDMLLLSDVQEHTRFIPNVGDHIADGLSALIGSGVLPDASSIMVINHTDGAMWTSSNGKRIRDLPADSNQVGSLHDSDLVQSVRDDIAFLRTSQKILQNTEMTGLMYDGRSHTLSLVPTTVNELGSS